jgi:hypothetical protein
VCVCGDVGAFWLGRGNNVLKEKTHQIGNLEINVLRLESRWIFHLHQLPTSIALRIYIKSCTSNQILHTYIPVMWCDVCVPRVFFCFVIFLFWYIFIRLYFKVFPRLCYMLHSVEIVARTSPSFICCFFSTISSGQKHQTSWEMSDCGCCWNTTKDKNAKFFFKVNKLAKERKKRKENTLKNKWI